MFENIANSFIIDPSKPIDPADIPSYNPDDYPH